MSDNSKNSNMHVVDEEGEREIKCGNGGSENEREYLCYTLVGPLIPDSYDSTAGMYLNVNSTHTCN
ncbi:hypothetical protein TSUD_76320 [Trifolium subterraneum]|uniref:Uncharacterized protein n=1 Tax=Trifolium subterraneum TaxID=3900 RepID=A0A2Z6MAL8_TRISU|nr:hypothetical protein TSUD_76320 [Trifolium subterraneum]